MTPHRLTPAEYATYVAHNRASYDAAWADYQAKNAAANEEYAKSPTAMTPRGWPGNWSPKPTKGRKP